MDYSESETQSRYCYQCGRRLRPSNCPVCGYGEESPDPIHPEAARRIKTQLEVMRALGLDQRAKRADVDALPLGTLKPWRNQ